MIVLMIMRYHYCHITAELIPNYSASSTGDPDRALCVVCLYSQLSFDWLMVGHVI